MNIRDRLEELWDIVCLGLRVFGFGLGLSFGVGVPLYCVSYWLCSLSNLDTNNSSRLSFPNSGSFVVDCKESDRAPMSSSIGVLTCQVKYKT